MSKISSSISFILIRPQMGENIGAAARVMHNFGFTDLRIVAPRDGWPNPAAQTMAAGGAHLIEKAKLFDNAPEAMADLQQVFATTARSRDMAKPAIELAEMPATLSPDLNTGILFGPENNGLSNDEVALADTILSIPTNPAYPSLNLAQAVALVAYSLSNIPPSGDSATHVPAPKHQLQPLLDYLEAELDARGFWKVEEKKPAMWRNIRTFLQRAELTEQEVRTLHGMLKCLSEFDTR